MPIFYRIVVCAIHILGMAHGAAQQGGMEDAFLGAGKFLTTFMEGDQLFLNIPEGQLDRTLLFVRYDHTVNSKYLQVAWSRHGDKILLKVLRIESTSGIVLPLKPKLDLKDNILAIFPRDSDRSGRGVHCINITDLVLRQDIEWSPGFSERTVPKLSLLFESKNLGSEVIIKARKGISIEGSNVSVPMYFAFCALDGPMKGRAFDYRMGFNNERINDIPYASHNSKANISRWRLEKKHKDQEVSEPVVPITFTLSPEIPKKWRPFVKAGILEWLPAFEAAGFKDALVVREVDTLSEWERFSIHTSMVYWGTSQKRRGTEGIGFGGNVANIIDERTGEILKGDIHMGNARQDYSDRYFIRAAPLDKRAQKFPFPDVLLGGLFQSLVAHEVGHVFGIMDANFGEYAYPFEKMADVDWLRTMGHTPSVMNYTRHNNIAQPEDSIPPQLLLQRVGPMDCYTIQWGYMEFPEGTTLEEEDAVLERMIRWQDSVPWYRFNRGGGELIGPADTDEIVEARNPVKSSEMALRNIRRVMELIPVACQEEKDNARLERLYGMSLELWFQQMRYVASLVGGYEQQLQSIDQPGRKYTPIARSEQDKALAFLLDQAFNVPDWLAHPSFVDTMGYSVHPDLVLSFQQRLLLELLRTQRMKRLEYMESFLGYDGVFRSYLQKLQAGVFRELRDGPDNVIPRNRDLHLTYIDKLVRALEQERTHIAPEKKTYDYTAYAKGLVFEQLQLLKKDIEKVLEHDRGSATGHWILCLQALKGVF